MKFARPEIEDAEMFYIPSLSCRTIVYKGLLLARRSPTSIANSLIRTW